LAGQDEDFTGRRCRSGRGAGPGSGVAFGYRPGAPRQRGPGTVVVWTNTTKVDVPSTASIRPQARSPLRVRSFNDRLWAGAAPVGFEQVAGVNSFDRLLRRAPQRVFREATTLICRPPRPRSWQIGVDARRGGLAVTSTKMCAGAADDMSWLNSARVLGGAAASASGPGSQVQTRRSPGSAGCWQ
jgi:hypothetical protein